MTARLRLYLEAAGAVLLAALLGTVAWLCRRRLPGALAIPGTAEAATAAAVAAARAADSEATADAAEQVAVAAEAASTPQPTAADRPIGATANEVAASLSDAFRGL